MIPRAKRYSVHIDYDFDQEISPEELQGAILRSANTPAFGIQGRIVINLITPRDGIGPVAPPGYTTIFSPPEKMGPDGAGGASGPS